jgi:GNAT superfamily N-acetyltransferase
MAVYDLSWRIEEICFNAFPSQKQVLLGDWLLRFAGGLSRRTNSVNPLRPECSGIEAVIAVAERLYRAHGQPAIFRVPTIVDPALDDALQRRRYMSEGETVVLYGAIDGLVTPDAAVRLLEEPSCEWLDAMTELQGYSRAQADVYRRIVGAIAIPARFASLAVDGAPAALAYGAIHDGLLCYESVITHRHQRRQGFARRVMEALAAWARTSNTSGMCLQVQADNAPARALYASFGFNEMFRYHYRRAPPNG